MTFLSLSLDSSWIRLCWCVWQPQRPRRILPPKEPLLRRCPSMIAGRPNGTGGMPFSFTESSMVPRGLFVKFQSCCRNIRYWIDDSLLITVYPLRWGWWNFSLCNLVVWPWCGPFIADACTGIPWNSSLAVVIYLD